MPVLFASKEIATLILAVIFGLGLFSNHSINVNNMVIEIKEHTVLNDGVEYRMILEVEGEKKESKVIIKPPTNEIHIEFEKKDLKIKFNKKGEVIEETDRAMVDLIYKEIVHYHGRKGVIGKTFDRIEEFLKNITRRG